MNSETSPDSAAAQETPDYLAQFEELLPALMQQAEAGLRIEDLREESCLRPEIEEQQLETRWLGVASSKVANAGTANAALDRIGARLAADGWERLDEVSHPPEEGGDVRVLMRQGRPRCNGDVPGERGSMGGNTAHVRLPGEPGGAPYGTLRARS